MGTKLRFPNDTVDQIEQLWWPTISQCFPYYASFWETFIGRKDVAGTPHPYGLKIPATIATGEAAMILSAYSAMVLAHYSEFCELAGAHHSLSEAESSYSRGNPREKLFIFLEHFNGMYDHLGTARNMEYRIWEQLGCIQEGSVAHAQRGSRQYFRAREFVDYYLRKNGQAFLVADHADIDGQVIQTRNHHVHDFDAFFVVFNGRFHVRLKADERRSRFANSRFKPSIEDACDSMRRHLELTERFLDGAEKVLAAELNTAFRVGGIDVDY